MSTELEKNQEKAGKAYDEAFSLLQDPYGWVGVTKSYTIRIEDPYGWVQVLESI